VIISPPMDNTISENQLRDIGSIQLTEKFQSFIRASSYLYSRAKLVSVSQIVLTVLIPIVLTTLAVVYSDQTGPASKIKVWASFYGIVITLLDLAFFEKLQKELKKTAAKVQECFDCDLLLMNWNYFRAGDKPTPEKIDRAARALRRELTTDEKNWYAPKSIGSLPIYLSRIICQRSNIWWDSEVRRRYTRYLTIVAVIIGLVATVVGLAKNMSMEVFVLTILAPIFPTIIWIIKEIKKQQDTIDTLDRLMKYVVQLWDDALNRSIDVDSIADKSRELQNELYVHRSSNQPIPNRIHKLLAKGLGTSMNTGAEELIEQAKAKLGFPVAQNSITG
jgi:hypothetical protein